MKDGRQFLLNVPQLHPGCDPPDPFSVNFFTRFQSSQRHMLIPFQQSSSFSARTVKKS